MPPKVANPSVAPEDNWVNVTWMPHASLSQTSHVGCLIRSSHATFGDFDILDRRHQQEWKVVVTLYGMGDLPLISGIESRTPAQPVFARRNGTNVNNNAQSWTPPAVAKANHDCKWDHVVNIPIRWRDLPRDAYLLFEILGHTGSVLSSARMPFFNANGRLSTGLMLLELQPSQQSAYRSGNQHHHLDYSNWQEEDPVWKASRILDQLERFEESRTGAAPGVAPDNRKVFGQMQSVPWLDAMTKEYCQTVTAMAQTATKASDFDLLDGNPWHLIVELPVFDVAVMHEETFYPIPQQAASGAVSPLELALYKKNTASNKGFHPLQLVSYVDYENEMDNPVEDKYRTLAHDLLRGLVDPALKPDREQRDRLAAIIASPSHHPTREEKDLLWRFRFSLVDNRRALTKFLLAVDWTVESEQVQAAELLEQWRRRSPIEVTDALKLLGKHVAFQTNLVRAYAIDTLAEAPDAELRLYLLQLVQALKYETMQGSDASRSPSRSGSKAPLESSPTPSISSLASFLIGRAAGNLQLANYLYWYLKVELQDPTHGARYRDVFSALKARLSDTPFRAGGTYGGHPIIENTSSSGEGTKESKTSFKSIVSSVSKLSSSLRGSEGVGSGDASAKKNKQRTFWDILVEQDQFVSGLMDIQMRCRDARGKKDAKESALRNLLAEEGYDRKPHRDPVPLPSAPHVMVNGVNPQTAKMFKSALYPALVDFNVELTLPMGEADFGGYSNTSYSQSSDATGSNIGSLDHLSHFKVIVKTGDDLRQDQLVIMMIQLMDGLLKRAALNLCLTPYSIIAMSPTSGLVEFVDGSMPISQILSKYNGSIMAFFQDVAPQKGAKYDVRPDVISTYVRSCAGYCVITFLLAVGDRHLDNILLDSNGHFVHIDFGFIFGRDPKPLPPAFRLTREMVEGMGGLESSEYRQFCSLACQAFNALRKSAGLVLNLLHLMSDAGIEDLSSNPSADAEGVIAKVEERFRLGLTDEQAERFFLGLINDCLSAIAPRVMDVFHSLAVARR